MRQTYKRQLLFSTAGLLSIAFFILLTDPSSLTAHALLLLPILVAVTVFAITHLLIQIFTKLPSNKTKTLSGVVAVGPTLVVMLGSLGQLGAQDMLLAVLLVGGFSWYVRRIQSTIPQA